MADILYTNFLSVLSSGLVDLSSDTLKIALLSGSYTPDATDSLYSDVSGYEAIGTNYSAGGKTLTSLGLTTSGTYLVATTDTVTWTNATITASGAVIYVSGASAAEHYLVRWIELGDSTSVASNFTINWSPSLGYLRLGAV
ncbi:MAG: hypothetical protein KDH96_07405 [Candidatus Riesia sp.]|nr:hypothetical protein [Candidatus Riesia sp.]